MTFLSFRLHAERFGYPPGEFTARRERLVNALRPLAPPMDGGTVILLARTAAIPGLRFRQDHDFYYLTGNEATNAVLVMDVPTGAAHLFLQELTETQIQFEGGNWLHEKDAAAKYGFASVQPMSALSDFLEERRRKLPAGMLWIRMQEPDEVDQARSEIANGISRRMRSPFGRYEPEGHTRRQALIAQFPGYTVGDVTPHVDNLRLIKSAREIEILRYNARISAEAMVRAIRASGPGKYEYELEAEATAWMVKHGLQAAAYPAIVGSGPMGNQWHYQDNGRQMKAGELVVMDYGGSLDYLTVDITRTWPVSGRFTDQQRRAYEATLNTQKAIIAAIRPGVARATIRRLAQETMKKHGFDPRYANSGHYVGLSVHDVGDSNLAFAEGMVLAIEPIIDLPDQQLHVRIEDTVLVTATGAEVLSTAVPKEVNDLLALMKR